MPPRPPRLPRRPPCPSAATAQNDAITRKSTPGRPLLQNAGRAAFRKRCTGAAQEPLSPRERQTLELLLAGNSEKQIAARLAISRHTVHVYVKSLYKRFGVNSRPELLARWVQR